MQWLVEWLNSEFSQAGCLIKAREQSQPNCSWRRKEMKYINLKGISSKWWRKQLQLKFDYNLPITFSVPLTVRPPTQPINKTAGEEARRQLHKNAACKSWQQHPTRHQLYGHLPPITKTIQVRQTRHTGHWCTPMDPHIWPGKSRTSTNIHSAAMWGYGM